MSLAQALGLLPPPSKLNSGLRPRSKPAPLVQLRAGTKLAAAANTQAPADSSAAMAAEEQQGGHYDSVAADYEKAFFYSSIDYRDWILGHLLCHFGLPSQVIWRWWGAGR